MQSYIQNPQIHARAVKDPKLLGGPFIDLDGQKVDEIKELLEHKKQSCKELLILHDAFKEMDRLVQAKACGDFLEPFYNRVPAALKGMVELVCFFRALALCRFGLYTCWCSPNQCNYENKNQSACSQEQKAILLKKLNRSLLSWFKNGLRSLLNAIITFTQIPKIMGL